MELFLASGFKLEAYDEVYRQHVCSNTAGQINESPPGQPSETSHAALDLFIFDDTSYETD